MATLLNGVNSLLFARGLAPVNSVVSGHPLHGMAVGILESHKDEVQSARWWYNVLKDYQLSIDPVTSKVPVPSDVIDIDDANYLVEDGYLYDIANTTFIFTSAPTTTTLVYNKAWEVIPKQAFQYIVALAKEEFIRPLSDPLKTTQAEKDISRAWTVLRAVDFRHKDISVQSNPLFAKWKAKMVVR
jgi:hypothetical protein